MSDCWACQMRVKLEASLSERTAAIAERYALQAAKSTHLDRRAERKAREEMEAMARPLRNEIVKCLERCHCACRWATLDDKPGAVHIEEDEGVETLHDFESAILIQREDAPTPPSGGWRDMQPNAIVVENRPSLTFEGPAMTGRCPWCGADLDALHKRGVIGHACFGLGDVINTEEPS